ncbi:HD domain-containing protein [Streptomyces sp. NPDC054849]
MTSVLELVELLHGSRDDHGLRTAALLRRSHPADKELQLAGLVHDLGRLLRPSEEAEHALLTAEAVRPLLGERVARLVRLQAPAGGSGEVRDGGRADGDALTALRQARDAAGASGLDAGVPEDWRSLLELVAARAHPPVHTET